VVSRQLTDGRRAVYSLPVSCHMLQEVKIVSHGYIFNALLMTSPMASLKQLGLPVRAISTEILQRRARRDAHVGQSSVG
jgi:hypothetical protein